MNYKDTANNAWIVRENAIAKLNDKGVNTLTDKELVYISTADENSLFSNLTAESVLDAFYKSSTSDELTRELSKIDYLSSDKINELVAITEFLRRHQNNNRKTITHPVDAFQAIRHLYSPEQEHFVVIGCNGANDIVYNKVITTGLINQSLIHPREVFSDAISSRCTSVIIAHNHPSRRLTPSPEDRIVTERIVKAGEILGIPVLDHLIFSDEAYFSFKEHQLI